MSDDQKLEPSTARIEITVDETGVAKVRVYFGDLESPAALIATEMTKLHYACMSIFGQDAELIDLRSRLPETGE
jgi:hypothetical protein